MHKEQIAGSTLTDARERRADDVRQNEDVEEPRLDVDSHTVRVRHVNIVRQSTRRTVVSLRGRRRTRLPRRPISTRKSRPIVYLTITLTVAHKVPPNLPVTSKIRPSSDVCAHTFYALYDRENL